MLEGTNSTYQHNVNTHTSTISILITFFLDLVKFKSRLAFALPGCVACLTMQAIQVYVYPKYINFLLEKNVF